MTFTDLNAEASRLLGVPANEVACAVEHPDGRFSDGYQPPLCVIKVLDGRRFVGATWEAAMARIKREMGVVA